METQRVLVVDDDPYLLQLIVDVLTMEGYQVAAARNGAEAMRFITEARPRVVLLDMQMPVLDGWEFVNLVRDSGLNLPVVIMTGSHNAQDWADQVKADDYLGKPFELDDLISKVSRFCY